MSGMSCVERTTSRMMGGARVSVDTMCSIGSSTGAETEVLHSGMGGSVSVSGVFS